MRRRFLFVIILFTFLYFIRDTFDRIKSNSFCEVNYMILTNKKWLTDSTAIISESVGLVDALLEQRGIVDEAAKEDFLSDNPTSWHDPFMFNDMKVAVDIIVASMENKESILIYGDYDADGVTATSILVRYFRSHNCNVSYIVPDRAVHGYGLTEHIVEDVLNHKPNLVITVDCGISNADTVKTIMENDIKVIVTDHHNVREELPKANAVICAKRQDSTYPFSDLCGAGVALKVVEALGHDGRFKVSPSVWKQTIELAGIATIADLVSLLDENRTIVKKAFQSIEKPTNPGIAVMNELLLDNDNKPDETYISFSFVPRINAAGRLYDSSESLKLFLSDDTIQAKEAAKALTVQNDERKEIEAKVFEEAVEQVESKDRPKKWQLTNTCGPLVVYASSWHQGVVGIVAGKLSQRFSRSAIVFTDDPMDDTCVRGSGRSYGDYDIFEALEKISDLCESFGGHKKAAGLVVKKNILGKFMNELEANSKAKLEENLIDTKSDEDDEENCLNIDVELPFEKITKETYIELKKVGPYGISNPRPTFVTRNVIITDIHQMSEGAHIRLDVFDGNAESTVGAETLSVVGFGMGHYFNILSVGDCVDIAYTLTEHTFRGVTSLSLHLVDIKSLKFTGLLWEKPYVAEKLYENKMSLDQISKLAKCGNDTTLLIPTSDQYTACYKALKDDFGEGFSTVDCDLLAEYICSSKGISITPFQVKRVLDVFKEAGLISLGIISPVRVCFSLLFTTGKAKLKLTETYMRLNT